ncbi:MAG TPA: hypothetical protein PLZ84_06425, partial [Clostridia bacterium]|nr:hypothetical protein [Clostridia bacterium]
MTNNKWKLSTDDTAIEILAEDNKLFISALVSGGMNWAKKPVQINLPTNFILADMKMVARWQYVSGSQYNDGEADTVQVLFREKQTNLALRSVWTAYPGPGAVTHQIFIDNITGKEIRIFAPQSLDVLFEVPIGTHVFYVHKDRAAAEIISYVRSGYGTYYEQLHDRYYRDIWTKPDDDDTGFIPLVMLHTPNQDGIYIGYVFNHGRISVSGIQSDKLNAEIRAGLYDDFCTTVYADEV